MRFIDTIRFSPVAQGKDLPFKADLFHVKYDLVPKTEIAYRKFIKERGVRTDSAWWNKQIRYCKDGIYIPNAIEKGGDNFVDGKDAIWHGNDVYLPDYDYWIIDRTIHITGRQYWYLNFWYIKRLDKASGRKKVLHPKFTDLSWENYLVRHLADKKGKDVLWAKSRQKGFSEEESSEIGYDYTFFQESQSLIIAGQETYARNSFKFVKRGLGRLNNTQFWKWPLRDNDDEYISKYSGSEIYKRTCKDNPQAASSLSPSRVLYEEIGTWAKGLLDETSEFIRSSLEAEGQRTSVSRYTGTAGEEDSGMDDMQGMWASPDSNNLYPVPNKYSKEKEDSDKVAIFIPAFKFEIIDEQGNSLVEKSIARLNEERLRTKSDKRHRYITQKPISPEEMFSANPNGYFGELIIGFASERNAYLLSHKEAQITVKGRLEWKTDIIHWQDGVVFVEDPEGDFEILEHPRTYETTDSKGKQVTKVYSGLYEMVTDSYDQDEAKTSKSKGSSWIKKTFLNARDTYNMYVARLLQRPELEEGGREVFYENTAKMAVYWGVQNLIEHSKILIFDWYKNHGMSSLLALRPQVVIAANIDDSKMSNYYGIDGSFVPYGLKMQKDYWAIKENWNNVYFLSICQTVMKFKLAKNYNCDDTIAMTWCTVSAEERKGQLVTAEGSEDTKPRKMVYRMKDGIMQMVKT